jgi:hypothetical protein
MNTAVAIQNQSAFFLPSRSFVVSVLSVVVLALVILYMYLLSMSVVHVVMRKELHHQSQMLESTIASLEADFMLAQHTVSGAVIETSEFTASSDKIFVTRKQPATVAISE